MNAKAEPLSIAVDDRHVVSGLWQRPADSRACYVMAHGAGAGMTHPFMAAFASDLAATLRCRAGPAGGGRERAVNRCSACPR